MKLIFDLSGIGGLAPKYYLNAFNEMRIGGENQYASGVADPTSRRLGYLSPASDTFTAVSGVSSSSGTSNLVGSVLVDGENTNAWFFDRGTMIYEITDINDTSADQVNGIPNVIGTDLEFYTVNGVKKFFYSYRLSSGGNIGIATVGASGLSSFTNTWFTASCAGASALGANNIKMSVADNGFMYVFDGASVHKIDGTTTGGANGTATMNVLIFPATFQLIDGIDLRGKMWIALMESSRNLATDTSGNQYITRCGVYVWDRQSTKANMTDFIQIGGVREIRNLFTFREVPACFTVSSGNKTELRIFNGNSFEVVEELSAEAYPRFSDSVNVAGNVITWLGHDGKIYRYGKMHPKLNDSLNTIGDISSVSGFGFGGAILGYGATEAYYLGVNIGTGGIIRRWTPLSGVATHRGYNYTLSKPLPKLSNVQSVTFYYLPVGVSGDTVNMITDTYFNQSSSTVQASNVFTHDDAARGYKYIQIGKRGVNDIQFSWRWNPSNSVGDGINLKYAEVEYEPAIKKL